jgi:hypothetical protein
MPSHCLELASSITLINLVPTIATTTHFGRAASRTLIGVMIAQNNCYLFSIIFSMSNPINNQASQWSRRRMIKWGIGGLGSIGSAYGFL